MAKQYQHLNLGERSLIQTQLLQGFKPSAISMNLGRPRSCIARELARNGWSTPLAIRSVGRPHCLVGIAQSVPTIGHSAFLLSHGLLASSWLATLYG